MEKRRTINTCRDWCLLLLFLCLLFLFGSKKKNNQLKRKAISMEIKNRENNTYMDLNEFLSIIFT